MIIKEYLNDNNIALLLPAMGLEPTTPRLEVWCAIQLRHAGEYLKEIKKVPPGFEPGLPDSKSGMLTITSRNRFLARVT